MNVCESGKREGRAEIEALRLTGAPTRPARARGERTASVGRDRLLLAALASFLFACSDGGCGGASSADADAASAAASMSAAPSAAPPRPRRANAVHASGPGAVLFRAVNAIELKDEQKDALDKIAADVREPVRDAADGGPPRNELREAHSELAAGVRAGKIDVAKMDAHYAALERTAKARQEREAGALNALHAALEPAQRAAVAAEARSLEEKREGRKPRQRPDGGPDPSAMRLKRYTHDLGLDPAQQKKAEALIGKDADDEVARGREEMTKQVGALIAAFEKDDFDANELDLGDAKRARGPLEEQAKLFGQLLPILRPEQRDRLAKRLAHAADPIRPHRGMGLGERVRDHDHDEGDVH